MSLGTYSAGCERGASSATSRVLAFRLLPSFTARVAPLLLRLIGLLLQFA